MAFFPNDHYSVKVPLQLLYLAGLHPRQNNFWGHAVACSILLTLVIIGPLAIVNLAGAHGDIDILAPTFETLMSVYQVSFKMLFLMLYRKQLSDLLNQMERFLPVSEVDDNEIIKKEVSFIEKLSNYCCTTYRNGGFALLICFLIKVSVTGEMPLLCYVPYGTIASYTILYILGSWLLITALFCVGGFDNLVCAIVFNVAVQHKILQKKLLDVNQHDTFNYQIGEDEHKKKLEEFINHHVLVTKFAQDFSDTFSFLMLNQFLMSVITICMELYIITESESVGAILKSVSYIFQSQVELALFCLPPTFVEIECDRLCDAIYAINWHLLRRKYLRQNIIFTLKRVQNPVQFSAFGFFYMNVQVYVSIMNAAISFYTLLKNSRAQ